MSTQVTWDAQGNWRAGQDGTRSGSLSQDGLRRIHDVLSRHVASGAVPGLVALIDHDGETHVEAMGTFQVGGGAQMQRDTIFRLASATKPITTAAAMILVDECRLRLDDPIDPWLPELANRQVLTGIDAELDETVPARRPITVRDLLTFTFGFGMVAAMPGAYPIQVAMAALGIGSDGTSPTPTPDEWIRGLGSLPLMYQPGERWLYNTGSDVLAVLIARVAGQSFEAFLQERICAPLGMTDTGFYVPDSKIHRLPTSYAHDPETGALVVYDDSAGGKWNTPPAFESGGDGMVSTVDDYLAFSRMMLNKGTHQGTRVLSRPAVELMTTDHLTPQQRAGKDEFFGSAGAGGFGSQGGFGFGFAVRTIRNDYASLGQFGWDGGLGTSAYTDPANRFTGILLTQAAMDAPDTLRLSQDFWTTAYQAID